MVQYVTSGKYSLCISTWYNLKQQKCLCHTDIGNLLCCPNRILQCAYLNPFSFVYVRFCIDVCDHNLYQGSVRTTAATCATRPGEAGVGRGMLLLFSCWLFRSKIIWQLTIDGSFYKGRRHALVKLVCWGRAGGKDALYLFLKPSTERIWGKWRSFASDESVGGMWKKGWFTHPGPVLKI